MGIMVSVLSQLAGVLVQEVVRRARRVRAAGFIRCTLSGRRWSTLKEWKESFVNTPVTRK
jgi:hypothetical protein